MSRRGGRATAAGLGATFRATDIADPAEAEAVVSLALKVHGRLDILVQNAGIYPWQLIENTSAEDWERVMAVNLRGTFNASRAALAPMKAERGGRMLFTSSITGPHVTSPGHGHYSASKAGINGFIRAAALEFSGYGITVNGVEPGNILTEAIELQRGREFIRSMQDFDPARPPRHPARRRQRLSVPCLRRGRLHHGDHHRRRRRPAASGGQGLSTRAAVILDFGDGYGLRQATAADRPALALICLRTGDAGADATAREDDPALMGQIYAAPYQALEPELAFLVEGPSGAAGYLLGAADTQAFNARLADRWYPDLRRRVADPGPDPSRWHGSDWARHAVHHADLDLPSALHPYPAHGHIDLLPEARGRGIGRRAMRFLEEALTERGAPGMHLPVDPRNRGALAFYEALGFQRLDAAGLPSHQIYVVKRFCGQGSPQ